MAAVGSGSACRLGGSGAISRRRVAGSVGARHPVTERSGMLRGAARRILPARRRLSALVAWCGGVRFARVACGAGWLVCAALGVLYRPVPRVVSCCDGSVRLIDRSVNECAALPLAQSISQSISQSVSQRRACYVKYMGEGDEFAGKIIKIL